MNPPEAPAPTELSEATLSLLATGETTLRKIDRSRPRDAVQTYFDGLITEAYEKWVAAGRPTDRRERPALRIDAPSEALAEESRRRLRASAVHLGVGVAFDPVTKIGRNKWRIAFSAQDRQSRRPTRR